jgi:hypothetical protein
MGELSPEYFEKNYAKPIIDHKFACLKAIYTSKNAIMNEL